MNELPVYWLEQVEAYASALRLSLQNTQLNPDVLIKDVSEFNAGSTALLKKAATRLAVGGLSLDVHTKSGAVHPYEPLVRFVQAKLLIADFGATKPELIRTAVADLLSDQDIWVDLDASVLRPIYADGEDEDVADEMYTLYSLMTRLIALVRKGEPRRRVSTLLHKTVASVPTMQIGKAIGLIYDLQKTVQAQIMEIMNSQTQLTDEKSVERITAALNWS